MTVCQRCNKESIATITSKFNTETICFDCKDDETKAPGYKAASQAEIAACRAGNYNFPGVGLSAADNTFLAELRAKR